MESVEFNCLESYLRSENFIEKYHLIRQKSAMNSSDKEECYEQVSDLREKIYAVLGKELEESDDLAPHGTCLIENFKKSQTAELLMKIFVYENAKMSKRKLRKALRALEYALEKRLEAAKKLCTANKVFGDMFDATYANANSTDSSEEDEPEEDYCERKYMVDNNFIHSRYHVNLNPKNVNVSNLNCDEIVKDSINDAVDELLEEFPNDSPNRSKRMRKCLSKAYRDGHYFENIARAVMLGEIGISETDKAEERRKFIDNMKQLYEDILKC